MTATTLPHAAPRHSTFPSHPPRKPRGRAGIAVVLLAGLLVSGLLRGMALDFQATNIGARGLGSSRGTLANMNSYALALLLGGLRGPLVMFLWTTSENQKTDRDLEDLDTKIEWIRMLQPEFDTVHLFQMWNKAYNLSVMMASPANKYTVIMEAIGYGMKVDEERPGDLNILQAIGSIYEGKLSAKNLPEAPFYIRQFREESMTDANRRSVYPDDARSFHRLSQMQPLLNEDNTLKRELISPARTRPPQLAPGTIYNDGSPLQYLAEYGRFPYGVPPQAMAFNYAKRAQVAMDSEGQKPLQLSSMVIDSQPGLLLKLWGEDEVYRGHELSARGFGLKLTDDILKNGQVLAEVPLDHPVADRAALDGALFSYGLAVRLCEQATREIHRHVDKPQYSARITLYQSHLDDLRGMELISKGDHDYLAACIATGPQRTALMRSAMDSYQQAMITIERNVLEHYTEDVVLSHPDFLPGYNDRLKLSSLPADMVTPAFDRAIAIVQRLGVNGANSYQDERTEYGRLISRCRIRVATLQKALAAQ